MLREETGLRDLVLKKYLGSDEFLDKSITPNKYLVRHFFHLICTHEAPETWQYYERYPSDGSPGPILIEFFWLPLVEASGKLDRFFATMLDRLPDK